MTDVTALRVLLSDYAHAIEAHLGTVREEFAQLEHAWVGLSDVYEGTAADHFRRVFVGTTERMRTYEHDAGVLLGVLRERITVLDHLDDPRAGI